jgi:hypothetical protein
MDRRNFLKLASTVGLSVISPVVYGERGLKEPPRVSLEPYNGVLYLFISAGGGWDPTSFCDPKGAAYAEDPDRMNNYLAEEIATAPGGVIRYAPVGGNAAFFDKYADRLLVINGVDMLTNGHDQGQRHTFSGRLAEGYPSMAAFLAASFGVEQPLAFLSFGAYSESRLSSLEPEREVKRVDIACRMRGRPWFSSSATSRSFCARAMISSAAGLWNPLSSSSGFIRVG